MFRLINILYLKQSINIDKYKPRRLRGRNMVNIHNQLTALLGWDKLSMLNFSNYTINSILLSEQQVAQMGNFGRKHQRYLASVQYKIQDCLS